MSLATFRTCSSCGFENAEVDKACPLCGGSSVAGPTAPADSFGPDAETLPAAPGSGARPLRTVYGGRYQVEGLVGRGGMGQVLRVRDTANARTMALKIIRPQEADDADRVRRFKREIDALGKIHHPAVLRIADWGREGNELFFVTELVDGEDLKVLTEKKGPWPVADATSVVATVAEALSAAHGAGIVHRDVKPSNIMLATDGSVRLLDFGLARGFGVDVSTLTKTGFIAGTPAYMAPEQFESGLGVDERTDVYSLGVVFFELLTGRLPFRGNTPIAIALKHKTEPPPPLRSIRPEVPTWVDRVVLRCLEKEPVQRFSSADALASVLRRPRTKAERRALPGGDVVVEDPTEVTAWALVLESPAEKTGWSTGMALRYDERYYQLAAIVPPALGAATWTYRFGFWREGEVFRRLVDYQQDAEERRAGRDETLGSKLGRWLSGRRPTQ